MLRLIISLAFLLGSFTSALCQNITQADFTGIIVPQYMASGNTNRIPTVFRASLKNLNPNCTYRYCISAALSSDIGTSNSAGGTVFMNAVSFSYSASPGINSSGNYSTFTTDATGNYTGWFCLVHNSNNRFTAGNDILPVILLNNGSGGTTVAKRLALDLSIRVLSFSSAAGATNCTGIKGATNASPEQILTFFDNINGTGRPISCTYAEGTNASIASAAGYYPTGTTGAWGSILPNTFSSGLKLIQVLSLTNASLIAGVSDLDGAWGCLKTQNPRGGSTVSAVLDFTSIISLQTISTSRMYYRSIANADWCTISTWESSIDQLSWTSAARVPDHDENTIAIKSPTTVRINNTKDTLVIDETSIETGATLIWKANMLHIANGSGPDLNISGAFVDSSTADTKFESGASWQLNANADYIKSGSGSAATWRDNYEGGIVNISPTSNWHLRKTGSYNPPLTSVSGSYYGNLIIESFSGSPWTTNVASSFAGNSNCPSVLGNLDIGGNGSDAITFSNWNTFTSATSVSGDLIVRSNCVLNNNGTGFDVKGDLQVDGSLLFDAEDLRSIKLSGSTRQEIKGSGNISIYALEIDKSVDTVHLGTNVTIDNALHLTNGCIRLNSHTLSLNNIDTNAVLCINGGLISEDNTLQSGKINNKGFFSRAIHSSYRYLYPFYSLCGNYVSLYYTQSSGADNTVAIATCHSDDTNQPFPLTVNNISDLNGNDQATEAIDRYWAINSTLNSTIADIQFTYADDAQSAPISTCDERFTLNTNGYESELKAHNWSGSNWLDAGGKQSTDSVNNTLLVKGVSPSSQWILKRPGSNAPLAILFLELKREHSKSFLQWSAAGNTEFHIQHSFDGLHFNNLDIYEDYNKSGYCRYYFQYNVLAGYYRVQAINSTDYSNVIELTKKNQENLFSVTSAPNKLIVNRLPEYETWASLHILDLQGKVLIQLSLNEESSEGFSIDWPSEDRFLLLQFIGENTCLYKKILH